MDCPNYQLQQASKRPYEGLSPGNQSFCFHLEKKVRIPMKITRFDLKEGTSAAMAGQVECASGDSQYPPTRHDFWHQTKRAGFRSINFRTVSLVSVQNSLGAAISIRQNQLSIEP